MVLHPDIARAKIDTCYLDTTYLNPKYCFPPQPQVIEACAILARKVAMGVSDQAPKLEELRPEAKVDIRFDAKPDVNAVKEELEEKERGIMRGWLVSRESGDDVKLEEGEEVRLEDGAAVKTEHSEEEKLRNVNDLMVPKPVVKAKPKARTLIVMGTYSIGKERIVKGRLRVDGLGSSSLSQRSQRRWVRRYTATRARGGSCFVRPIPSCTHCCRLIPSRSAHTSHAA
jgi:DNA cross-link repair 1A protein